MCIPRLMVSIVLGCFTYGILSVCLSEHQPKQSATTNQTVVTLRLDPGDVLVSTVLSPGGLVVTTRQLKDGEKPTTYKVYSESGLIGIIVEQPLD